MLEHGSDESRDHGHRRADHDYLKFGGIEAFPHPSVLSMSPLHGLCDLRSTWQCGKEKNACHLVPLNSSLACKLQATPFLGHFQFPAMGALGRLCESKSRIGIRAVLS